MSREQSKEPVKESPVKIPTITGVDRLVELLLNLDKIIGVVSKVMALILAIQQGAVNKGIGSGFIPTPVVLKRAHDDLTNSLGWFRDVLKQMKDEAPEEVNIALGTVPELKKQNEGKG